MKRLLLLGGAVAAHPACMTLDGLIVPGEHLDAYALETDIPRELLEEVSFESGDGTVLAGVWAHQPEARPPLIFFHGNWAHLDNYMGQLELYWSWERFDVFIFDYRGFGRSEGVPTYEGVLEEDGLAAVRYVSETTGVPPEEIPWVSDSLGSSVVIHTNDEIDAAAIVIDSVFASAGHLIDANTGLDLPTGWFFEDPWDNVEAIARIRSPALIIHGTADDYVHPEFAQPIYEAAPEPKELWQPEGVDHSDAWRAIPEEYTQRVSAWYDRWL